MFVHKLLLISLVCWGSASCTLWNPEKVQNIIQSSKYNAGDPAEVQVFWPGFDFSILNVDSDDLNDIKTETPVTEAIFNYLGENQQCPPNESSFSKNDINILVEYMINTMNIYQNINDSYYSQAVAIRGKHENDIKEFRRRLEERPQHLQHILEDMIVMRKKLEPIITNINDNFQKYSSHETSLNKRLDHAQAVLKQLDNTKQICQLMNCGQQYLKMRTQDNEYPYMPSRDSQDLKYCSTLTRITDKINASLTHFQNEFIQNMSLRLIHDDKYYSESIQDLKKNVKELAVGKFGATMYNILNIQDDYYHLSEALNDNKVVSELEEIKKNSLEIDYFIVKLESALKKYEKYCTSCNQPRLYHMALPSQDDDSPNNSQVAKDIVDEFIDTKIFEIETKIYANYANIFKELKDMLNEKDLENTYFANLQPIQDEITMNVVEERELLDKLTNSVPLETIDKVSELYKKSMDMLQTLQQELNDIDSFLS